MLTQDQRHRLEVEGIHCAGCASAKGSGRRWMTLETKLLFSAILTAPLLLHMLFPWHLLAEPYVQLSLATPVFLVGLIHFGRSALNSVRVGLPNMDLLVVTGITASYLYSLYGTLLALGPDFLFYETAASITTLVLLGNFIEKRAVSKTTSAVEELTRLQPETAKRVILIDNEHESSETIAVAQVNKGDLILASTGDKIAVDGVIVWGEGSIDEALLTGESIPVERGPQDAVIGGATLASGSIKFRATAVGDETALSQIIRMVLEARAKKPGIQRLADRVAAVFTPIVFAIAVLTLVISAAFLGIELREALIRSVAVLVIACPCAMGLATPTAVMVGIGRAAREGILIKSAAALERLANVKTVVFDKTGTLTTGLFKIERLEVVNQEQESTIAALAALERHSSHPLAQSVVKALADTVPISLTAIKEQGGFGITGLDRDGNTFRVGSWRIAKDVVEDLSHDLYMLKNGSLVAYLDLSDEIKTDAKRVVDELHANDINTVMLSGDREERCLPVIEATGIKDFRCKLLPEQKLEILAEFQRRSITAFVGDGINDAPSLARADIGISLSGAAQAAIDSAEIILLNGELGRLLGALHLSRATLSTIKQNLFWAFFYNTAAIPLAAAGYLSPIVAALAMAFSDLIVIGNSLRLRTKEIS